MHFGGQIYIDFASPQKMEAYSFPSLVQWIQTPSFLLGSRDPKSGPPINSAPPRVYYLPVL